jgi:hypothetical protein
MALVVLTLATLHAARLTAARSQLIEASALAKTAEQSSLSRRAPARDRR